MTGPETGASGARTASLLLPPARIAGSFDWPSLFGRPGDVVLEVGSGKGKFLAEESRRHPDRNFLGVERSIPWLRKAEERLRNAAAGNVLLLRADAKDVLARLVPPASLLQVHVYFPDPWPKKRHRKRRLFDPETALKMRVALEPGGELHVATDEGSYWEEIVAVLDAVPGLRRDGGVATAGGTTSSFAVKYLREGRRIHEAVWRRDAVARTPDRG